MKGLLLGVLAVQCLVTVAQDAVVLEGYVFSADNAGYLNGATVTVLDAATSLLYGEASTNMDGFFALEVPRDRDFLVRAHKPAFVPTEGAASSKGLTADKTFVKLALERAPGYRLEVTLAQEREEGQEEVDAISGSLIEVYNNTKDAEVLTLRDHPSPYFSFQLEQGNHYTLLIRSPGYFTKRIESFVNIDGCILCMDGVSEIGPGVSDNLSYGNDVGTLLANIELKPLRVDAPVKLNNIYYPYKSAEISEAAAYELDKVVELLKVNPSIVVELGSHSDARGDAKYNRGLSQERAQSAVDYIAGKGIPGARLRAVGYGESQPVNKCTDDVVCTEAQFAVNRRTELKITGFTDDPFAGKPLAEIIAEETLDDLLAEVMATPEVRIPEDTGAESGGVEAVLPVDSLLAPAEGEASAKTRRPATVSRPEATANAGNAIEVIEPGPRMTSGTRPAAATPAAATPAAAAPGEPEPEGAEPIRVIVPEQSLTNVTPLTLPTGAKFTGYRVLVFQSPVTLADANGELFFKFGTLKEDRLADQTFGYMSGAFSTEAEARSYLGNVATLFPAARLLRYVNGYIIENSQ